MAQHQENGQAKANGTVERNGRTRYEKVQDELRKGPKTWLVTGCAGFIGSDLLKKLLELGQTVVGLDNTHATASRGHS